MLYRKPQDLPDSVRGVLPKHAQEIYQEAFNNAYEEYESPEERRNPEDSREEVAHKVAWSAVKRVYKKDISGHWVRK